MLFVNLAWESDGWTGPGGGFINIRKRGWLAVHPLDAGGRSGGGDGGGSSASSSSAGCVWYNKF